MSCVRNRLRRTDSHRMSQKALCKKCKVLFLCPKTMKGGDAMQRFDTTTFQATKTDEGFIADTPIIGRTGLLRYQNADGSERWEYRPPEEAFSTASLASIRGKPITVGHKAMVTAGNVRSVQPVGTVLNSADQPCSIVLVVYLLGIMRIPPVVDVVLQREGFCSWCIFSGIFQNGCSFASLCVQHELFPSLGCTVGRKLRILMRRSASLKSTSSRMSLVS